VRRPPFQPLPQPTDRSLRRYGYEKVHGVSGHVPLPNRDLVLRPDVADHVLYPRRHFPTLELADISLSIADAMDLEYGMRAVSVVRHPSGFICGARAEAVASRRGLEPTQTFALSASDALQPLSDTASSERWRDLNSRSYAAQRRPCGPLDSLPPCITGLADLDPPAGTLSFLGGPNRAPASCMGRRAPMRGMPICKEPWQGVDVPLSPEVMTEGMPNSPTPAISSSTPAPTIWWCSTRAASTEIQSQPGTNRR
jgi:hypothetical protein